MTVRYDGSDNDAYFDSITLFRVSTPLGISEPGRLDCHIYPIPAGQSLHIDAAGAGICQYHVYDLTGRELLTGGIADRAAVDISALTTGCYLITLYSAEKNEKAVWKFIKE
jgi:hypothetical protein